MNSTVADRKCILVRNNLSELILGPQCVECQISDCVRKSSWL